MTKSAVRRSVRAAILGLTAVCGSASAQVTPQARMLRNPDISADKICFVYANDIWIVPKTGGTAAPLSSPAGRENFPKFSPDGQTIGFGANYDGGFDLYTLSLAGGVPTRVTHHPTGETLSDWTPDGKLLFVANGLAGLGRQSQIFTVSPTGGLPEKLPVPYGAFASVSPSGEWLAYIPHSTDNRTWKRYRGGMATNIWLFNLKTKASKQVTDWEGTDSIPMWVPGGDGKTLYYLSDAGPEHRLNIWAYFIDSGERRQITNHKDFDVRWPSIGPGSNGKGEIVFQLGSELRVLDLATGNDAAIKVTIPGDRPTLRPRTVKVSGINAYDISPSGKRVVVEGRGDLWSAPAKEGVVRNLTRTDGVFERDPSWSPDGKWIAYFSDASGEYELWIRPADSKPPEEEKKTDDKKDEKKDGEAKADGEKKPEEAKADEKKEEPKKPEPKPEPRKLTNLGAGFRSNPAWSPDSKHVTFTDDAGRLHLTTVETGETKVVDTDPWANQPSASWSHDSNWIAYDLADNATGNQCVWLFNVKTGEKNRITSPQFPSGQPAFDRKGDFIYFQSSRAVDNPTYSDLDTTFAYTSSEQLYMLPVRKDVKNPFAPTSDEEQLKKEEPKKDEKKDDKKEEKKDADKPADKSDKPADKPAGEQQAADDGVSGSWACEAKGVQQGGASTTIPFTINLKLGADGTSVTGSVVSAMGGGTVNSGSYDKSSGTFTVSFTAGQTNVTITGTIKNDELNGSWSAEGMSGSISGKRTAKGGSGGGSGDDKAGDKKDEPAKEVKIDLEGIERRAMLLPITPGAFGTMKVTDSGHLIYARFGTRNAAGGPDIKIFDPKDEAKEEKTVTAGAGGFALSADGKKIAVGRGGSVQVLDASAGGGKPTSPPLDNLNVTINPRNEWKQIFTDTWRLNRDFFYEPTMHGVDWPKMREVYGKMIDDCVNREDVTFVLAELISELNVGHAYIGGPGDVESAPSMNVGLLGCDYELVRNGDQAAYRISAVHEGGPWDADARGPLSQPGVEVKVGDYLLAVNGVPVDTAKDPWAAFIGTADKPTSITVGPNPAMDDKVKEIVVKPIGNEGYLRFRAWIESKRAYVEKKTDGKVGYIYVPNTGVDGQNELFRQFVGERGRPALIIDERWNGGGQIPTRFIELLNRQPVNYWARRHGNDWPWPPDAHFGPKCMLINGLAGSGGDAFPAYFKQVGLGKLIGMRTWGGLVGISGNPGLIDGGSITVPTFGFYRPNGNWGIEGHGVDPDIEVVDDPAKMQDGGDPQLDAAIAQMEQELKTRPYIAPKRPASPNRAGMGIPPEQR